MFNAAQPPDGFQALWASSGVADRRPARRRFALVVLKAVILAILIVWAARTLPVRLAY